MKNGMVGLVTLVALGIALPAQAGYPQQAYLACYKGADGSGYCYGTLAGARASSDQWAYAEFEDYAFNNTSTHSRWFYAYQNNTSYSCQLTSSASPALVDLWSTVMVTRGYFYVAWDASGACTSLEAVAGSQWYY